MKTIGIYKITAPNNKVYIGQSVNIEKRWRGYRRLDCNAQTKLYRSLLKYGANNCNFEIIFPISKPDNELLNKLEAAFIEYYDSMNSGLNCTTGGDSFKISDETKERLRITSTGKKHSDETKLKISLANKGKVVSEETKRKMRKPKSEETKRKMRKPKLEDAIQNMINGNTQKKVVEQWKDKILINIFKSTGEAKRQTGISNISSCCLNKLKSAGGYQWKYNKII